jgi:hypothetical protein
MLEIYSRHILIFCKFRPHLYPLLEIPDVFVFAYDLSEMQDTGGSNGATQWILRIVMSDVGEML